jgi:hypothetical protein
MKLRYKPYAPELFSKIVDDYVEDLWNGFKGEFFT